MSKSLGRVRSDALRLGLAIEIVALAAGTRTAGDAASSVGCAVGQIVKSIVFRAATSHEHFLFLTAGTNLVDAARAAGLAGTGIEKADAASIRAATGFAIGGVAPLGHIRPLRTWFDRHILDFAVVWAAAGTPNHVFVIDPRVLQAATGAIVADFAAPDGIFSGKFATN